MEAEKKKKKTTVKVEGGSLRINKLRTADCDIIIL